jgi:hypothetical protein
VSNFHSGKVDQVVAVVKFYFTSRSCRRRAVRGS